MKKFLATIILIALLTGQVFANTPPDSLSPASINTDMAPERAQQVRNQIGHELEPGAIGNQKPLLDLIAGKLPEKVEAYHASIASKLHEAAELATRLALEKRDKVPAEYRARAEKAISKLIRFNDYLNEDLHLFYAADNITGSEDYLLGFNHEGKVGLSAELVEMLYAISPVLLAQYVYHECFPEEGSAADRQDHRRVYSMVQTEIFGAAKVAELGKILRDFINVTVEDLPKSHMPFEKLIMLLPKLFTNDTHRKAVVELQFKGPSVNAATILTELDKDANGLGLSEEGRQTLREAVAMLSKYSAQTKAFIEYHYGKYMIKVNRQELLATMAYWATNGALREMLWEIRTPDEIFTRSDFDHYIESARQNFKTGNAEEGINNYGRAINVITTIVKGSPLEVLNNEDVKATVRETLDAFDGFCQRTITKDATDAERADLESKFYYNAMNGLVKAGILGLARLLASEGSKKFPNKREMFDDTARTIEGAMGQKEAGLSFNNMKECIRLGDFEGAIYSAKLMLIINPLAPSAYSNLGLSYTQAGRYRDALSALNAARRLGPQGYDLNFLGSYENLGTLYSKMGLYAKAVDTYKIGIAICEAELSEHPGTLADPTFRTFYWGLFQRLGRVQINTGRLAEAKAALEKAHDVMPADEETNAALADINGRLARGNADHIKAALENIHFIYGFNLSDADAQQEIRDFQQILLAAKKSGKNVKVVYSLGVVSLDDVIDYSRQRTTGTRDIIELVDKRSFINDLYQDNAVKFDRILENISNGALDPELLLSPDHYNNAWFGLLNEKRIPVYRTEETVDSITDLLRAQYYYQRGYEALQGAATSFDFEKALEWKKAAVKYMVSSIRRTNELIMEKVARLKIEDPDSIVVVVNGIFSGGSERPMADKGYAIETHYPYTSGFSSYLVPEYQIMTEKITAGKGDVSFGVDEEKVLKKSLIGDLLLTMSTLNETFGKHQLVRRILGRMSDEDIDLLVSEMKEDDSGLDVRPFVLRWMITHAKITDTEKSGIYYAENIGLEGKWTIQNVDYLMRLISHSDIAMARQAAVILGELMGSLGRNDFGGVPFADYLIQKFFKGILTEANDRKGSYVITEFIEKYLNRPSTQLQYFAALVLKTAVFGIRNRVSGESAPFEPELNEDVLGEDVLALANNLLSSDASRSEAAKTRIFKESLLLDFVDAYMSASSEKDRQALISAMIQLKDKQITERLIAGLYGSSKNTVLGSTKALGLLGDSRAVMPLLYQLSASDKDVRDAARAAVMQIGPGAVPILEDIIASPDHPLMAKSGDELKALAAANSKHVSDESVKNGAAKGTAQTPDDTEIGYRARIFKENLMRLVKEQPQKKFILAIDTDIGQVQHGSMMPLYKALDQLEGLRDENGKPLLPNLLIRRDSGVGKLADVIKTVAQDNAVEMSNIFVVARQSNLQEGKLGTLEGKAWISAIDDANIPVFGYIPVFETATLTIMSALNANPDSITRLYNAISKEPITAEKLEQMLENRSLYILPHSIPVDSDGLRDLNERVKTIYLSA